MSAGVSASALMPHPAGRWPCGPDPRCRRAGWRRSRRPRPASGRSPGETLESLGVARQLLVEDAVEEVGPAMALDVLADRLPGDLLHGPALEVGPTAQRVGLVLGQPQRHRHADDDITSD